jgi:hypothetical protein
MIDEGHIRELLIESCHSSADANRFFKSHLNDAELLECLVNIAVDAEDYGGDAPMEAAYWVSEFPAALIKKHEKELIAVLSSADVNGSLIALALGKTQSLMAKPLILAELGDGQRYDAWLFRKALAYYDGRGE